MGKKNTDINRRTFELEEGGGQGIMKAGGGVWTDATTFLIVKRTKFIGENPRSQTKQGSGEEKRESIDIKEGDMLMLGAPTSFGDWGSNENHAGCC